MDRETYIGIRNYLKNELGINRETIIAIIREEVQKEIPRFLANTYADENIKGLIEKQVKLDIRYTLSDLIKQGISAEVRAIIEEKYEIKITKKQ